MAVPAMSRGQTPGHGPKGHVRVSRTSEPPTAREPTTWPFRPCPGVRLPDMARRGMSARLGRRSGGEAAAQRHEQRLEREGWRQVELLERPPRLPGGLGGLGRADETLARRVLP